MVAIFKLIISAALLSSASVSALPVALTETVNGQVHQVSEPVLAVRPKSAIVGVAPTSTTTSAPSSTTVAVSVSATGALGLLVVGEPVLAIRPEVVVPAAPLA